MSKLVYLEVEDILESHSMGMSEFGGTLGGYSLECIEKRVVEPQTKYFGDEQYPGLFKKAALYWYRITTTHCFSDGNKRAGLISTELFLRYNGYKINADQETLYVYCLLIGNHKTRPSLTEVEDWLEKNVIRLEHALETI